MRVSRFFVVPLVALLVTLSGAAQALAQSAPADLTPKIDALIESAYSADAPGIAAIVTQGNQVVYRGARGMANLEYGIPLKPEMVFRLGSITKQFTAAAIMLLCEEGKISLDDEITKFLPDYPTQGTKITVEHLLTHTSGIKSYTNMPGWMETQIVNDMTVEQLIDGFKNEPMEFAPGEKFNYNNSGYVLLGAIIEKASDKSYADFVQERIFEPLSMENSYYGSFTKVIPYRASGYGGSPDRPQNARYISMSQPYAAGSLLSSVDDMAKWNAALFAGKVVNEESLQKMITPYEPADGSTPGYAYGLTVGDIRGHKAIQHGGGIFGFSTFGAYLPDDDIYVAVLSNTTVSPVGPDNIGTKIAALVAGDAFPVFTAVEVSPEVLKKYVGVYRVDPDATRTVTVEDGKLYTQRTGGEKLEATPSSETEFFYTTSASHFKFVVNDGGEVTGMQMHQNGSKDAELAAKTDEEVMTRKVVEVDADILDDYVGKYQLAPGFVLTISRDGDQLKAQATGQPEFEIFPESDTKFFLKVVDAQIVFERGDDGEVNEITLHQAGQEVPGKRIE